jgi:acyl-CoA synthetase (AMP-forming)/AMP-acid ligase II
MAEFTFAPLTPASFLDRSAAVFADRIAIVDGERRFTYQDMSDRCRRLVAALAAEGVGHEDRVAALCANSHVMLELHHAVPALGATLVTVNVRLSAAEMAGILDHSGASLLVATHEFADRARELAGQLNLPCFIAGGSSDSYEGWIADADPAAVSPGEIDERQLLAINYTSGTTGRPKGVMYHHRGAYLQATAMAYHARLGPGARYLWTLLARLDEMRFAVTHLYGLTETYGPLAINEWQPEWDSLEPTEQATLRARQGAPNIIARPLRVLDEQGQDVPSDGETIGEIAVSGNNVMLGYYRDDEATREVTRSGCFLTGDLAVRHPDGYVEIRDRSKDIIVSGGENIASVEVERVLDSHPSVVESAVVGIPDERWGEVAVAFVLLRKSGDVDAGTLADFARERLARYKVPKRFEFCDLPKTSTGKIQKNVLRDTAKPRPGNS